MIENPQKIKNRTIRVPSPGSVGAASELIVCADMLQQGWQVFRAVSPQASCDLIAIKGPCTLKIEVRTSSSLRSFSAGKHGQYDILAIVKRKEVLYIPSLPSIEE